MHFGVASCEIAPPFKTKMAGYGARNDTFDGVNDPLTYTAIVLEEGGNRALLGAVDLCRFPVAWESKCILNRLARAAGCKRDNVMINASHTHGGPDTSGKYCNWLYDQVVNCTRQAASRLRKGTLWFGEGRTNLPMNRRPKRGGRVLNAPNPGGPTDRRLQFLVIRDHAGRPAVVGMKVSCHPVATGAQHLLTADYPGAWRAAFSQAFGPKVVPVFLQGAGADARPRHAADGEQWRYVPHAELPGIGSELMVQTMAVLAGTGLKPVDDLVLEGKIAVAACPCERLYTSRNKLKALKAKGGQMAGYAERNLERLDAGEKIPDQMEYRVQTLWLNRDLALIGLDVEPLCALGKVVEDGVAPKKGMLLGYVHGSQGYTPDSAEMKRGGYETMSYLGRGLSGPLKPGVEQYFDNCHPTESIHALMAREVVRQLREQKLIPDA